MFIGRREEIKALNKAYLLNQSNLIIVSGKKRIGKTELINYFSNFKPTIFYSAKDYQDSFQLISFSKEIISTDSKFKYLDYFKNWESAFYAIGDIIHKEKLIIVLDEFDLIYKGNEEILEILIKIWKHTLSNSNIMLIITSSNNKFIQETLLPSQINKLIDIHINLEELSEKEVNDFLVNFPDDTKTNLYKLFGGYPYYLSLFNDKLSLIDNIKELILSKDGKLYNEADFLLHNDLRELSTYNIIIQIIALGYHNYSDILERTQIEQRKLSVYIKNLVDVSILNKVEGFRGKYTISNKFIEFWFRYCYPNISNLENRKINNVIEMIKSDLK